MPSNSNPRTVYGPNKYAAIHLLLSKWLRNCANTCKYHYVTLGGTELRDVQSLYFIDPLLTLNVMSIEGDPTRYAFATTTAERLKAAGVTVNVVRGDIFDVIRSSQEPHFYFIDLEGTCALGDYYSRFADLFRSEVIKEGDTVFITSYLGRHIGWPKLFQAYDAEFRILGLSDAESKRTWYRRAHPSFTLFRALSEANLLDELSLQCIGCVEYRDKSPMAVYGYIVSQGRTGFPKFIRETPYFHMTHGYLGA